MTRVVVGGVGLVGGVHCFLGGFGDGDIPAYERATVMVPAARRPGQRERRSGSSAPPATLADLAATAALTARASRSAHRTGACHGRGYRPDR